MSELKVKEKDIVVPGDVLAVGMDYIPTEGTYRLNDNIYASRLGLIHIEGRALKIIALNGAYIPKRNDIIIGRVTDVSYSGWNVETNTAYRSMLSMKEATTDFIKKGEDLTKYYNLGDYVVAKIINVTSQFYIDISLVGSRNLGKLVGGRIVEVNPHKVPRIIGKQGSMVSMIKEATGCKIVVGQNGRVWVKGEPENELLTMETINFICEKAHISGLTNMVKEFLEKKTNKKLQGGAE